MNILAYGHPTLRVNCKDIDKNYPSLRNLLKKMDRTMEGANGCGLAAPQVGLPINLFIVKFYEREKNGFVVAGLRKFEEVFINARIISSSDETSVEKEGCLSIPKINGSVERPVEIEVEYLNRRFEKKTSKFSGITARIIQHEFDHTRGILFIDKMPSEELEAVKYGLEEIKKGNTDVSYELEFA